MGDQVKDAFIAQLLDIWGDTRALLLYDGADTTTTTGSSRHARTFTHNATVAGDLNVLGSGVYRQHDGSADESDAPDAADLSFGDGTIDQPFSIVALVNPDVVNTVMAICGKNNDDNNLNEYLLFMNGSGYPAVNIHDESATGRISRIDETALSAGTWVLLTMTYDGSRSNLGIRIYKDTTRVDDASNNSGTYTAMESLSSPLDIGHLSAGSGVDEGWDGGIALVGVVGRELTVNDVEAMVSAVNSFFDLSL
jgi:hypothetical protein